MGAGISVRNESDLPILVVCSQLSPLHWGRCDPGETWNAKNQQRMGKVSVTAHGYDHCKFHVAWVWIVNEKCTRM
eukprot:m.118553 g.118553  ORF g.118553 m.118553 type:complete len:75 (-) comp10984_c0_seq3:95-319(-)